VFTQPVVQNTGEMPGQPLTVTLFPSGASERWMYEDSGNGFGPSMRRKFSARGNTIEISAPDGSYRPQARSMVISLRTSAKSVMVNGAPADWTAKDGVVTIKMPDHFERVLIRID